MFRFVAFGPSLFFSASCDEKADSRVPFRHLRRISVIFQTVPALSSNPFGFRQLAIGDLPPTRGGESSALYPPVGRVLLAFRNWMTHRRQKAATELVLIVRRGMSAEYYSFCSILATTNRVPVLFDRRVNDRRQRLEPYWGSDRRSGADRRSAVPTSWTESQFALTRVAADGAPLIAADDLPQRSGSGLEPRRV
jgi:hypothetical protein